MADKKADIKTVQKIKGVDFCISKSHCYIIRSDLGCYMKAKDFNKGSDLSIHALHPCCQNGDHYLADSKSFYIIKGDKCRRVTDLTKDTGSKVFKLSDQLKDGHHYLAAKGKFYIIFQKNNKTENNQGTKENNQGTTGTKENNQGTTGTTENNQGTTGTTENNQGTTGTTENNQGTTGTTENNQGTTGTTENNKGIKTYSITTDLSKDPSPTESQDINGSYKDGLYYWGDKNHLYFLKQTEWGFEYYKGKDLNKDECTDALSVHPDVLNFLPDGLSKTNGPAFGKWVKIKYVSNDAPIPVMFQKTVTKKVGYNKEKMSQITHNWRIEASGRISTGKLASLIADAQFTLSGVYGGARVNTEKDIWTEETVEEEQLSFQLEENGYLYVWQFQLGFGSEPVLFWRNLKITDMANRPEEVPMTLETLPGDQQSLQENRATSIQSLQENRATSIQSLQENTSTHSV